MCVRVTLRENYDHGSCPQLSDVSESLRDSASRQVSPRWVQELVRGHTEVGLARGRCGGWSSQSRQLHARFTKQQNHRKLDKIATRFDRYPQHPPISPALERPSIISILNDRKLQSFIALSSRSMRGHRLGHGHAHRPQYRHAKQQYQSSDAVNRWANTLKRSWRCFFLFSTCHTTLQRSLRGFPILHTSPSNFYSCCDTLLRLHHGVVDVLIDDSLRAELAGAAVQIAWGGSLPHCFRALCLRTFSCTDTPHRVMRSPLRFVVWT